MEIDVSELIEIGYTQYGKVNGAPNFRKSLRIYLNLHGNPLTNTRSSVEQAAMAWTNEFKQFISLDVIRKCSL